MKKYIFTAFSVLFSLSLFAQALEVKEDSLKIREIYDAALVKGQAYNWLDHLSNNICGRLSGSLNAQRAVEYTKAELEELGLDKVWLQPVMVPKWTRGAREHAYIQTGPCMKTEVNITALGGSVATDPAGIPAQYKFL